MEAAGREHECGGDYGNSLMDDYVGKGKRGPPEYGAAKRETQWKCAGEVRRSVPVAEGWSLSRTVGKPGQQARP